jgi:hypothetical protein
MARGHKLATSNVVFDRERITGLLSGRNVDEIPNEVLDLFLNLDDADEL